MSLPIPNLDDKTFNELFEEARKLIPRYSSKWTDHNLSDPGITFIDLFAWLAEMQIYSLNRINDKNKLKFLALLGEEPHAAKPATVDVSFYLNKAKRRSISIQPQTQVAATDPETGRDIVFETTESINVSNLKIERIFSWDSAGWFDNALANDTNGGFYFPFGEQVRLHNKVYLGFSSIGDFPTGEIKLTINIYDSDLPQVNNSFAGQTIEVIPSATLKWEYWNGSAWRSLAVQDNTVALTKTGRVAVKGPDNISAEAIEIIEKKIPIQRPSNPLYWLRISVVESAYEIPPRIASMLVNTVPATQYRTIYGEWHNVKNLPCQKVSLHNPPILNGTLKLELFEEDGKYHPWREVNDFDASGPNDRHYSVDLIEGSIHFGDGIRGRIPAPLTDNNGHNIRVLRYQAGGGEDGNVLAGKINRVLNLKTGVENTDNIYKVRVDNANPATGGAPAESVDEALERVRRDLKNPYRAITSSDYEILARATPGLRLARVKVLPLYHPYFPCIKTPGVVTVVVVPYTLQSSQSGKAEPSAGFLQTVKRFMLERRLVATDLHVIGPHFAQVMIAAQVQIDPRFIIESVKQDIQEALNRFLHPISGGVDGKGWPFGRSVLKSEVYQIVQQVEGVRCVDNVVIKAEGRGRLQDNGDLSLPSIGLIYAGEHKVTINDSRLAANGAK